MAKSKADKQAEAEEELLQSGYSAETAHGVDEDHPDETVEEFAARARGNPEEVTQEQREALAEVQEDVEGAAPGPEETGT